MRSTLSGEPGQSFAVDIHSKRVAARDEDVHPQIELQPVNQERLLQVFLHHIVLSEGEVLNALTQKDASALAARLGLGDHHHVLLLLHELAEIIEFRGQYPGPGIEVVVVWKGLGHFDEVSC